MIYQPTDRFSYLDFAKYARSNRQSAFLREWSNMIGVKRAIEFGFRDLYNLYLCDCHWLEPGEIGCTKTCEGHK